MMIAFEYLNFLKEDGIDRIDDKSLGNFDVGFR
jgi:hypothetical protein